MKPSTKTLLVSATAALFALGAANAYAAEPAQGTTVVESKTWVSPKTAVTEKSAVIRMDQPLPDLIVPLNTDIEIRRSQTPDLRERVRFDRDTDLRDFDLVEDSPVFIGAQGATEFDTREARQDTGSYPETLGVVPLFPVAGAGLATSF